MNALKHMEAVFVIALSVLGAGSYLAATAQDASAAAAPAVQAMTKTASMSLSAFMVFLLA